MRKVLPYFFFILPLLLFFPNVFFKGEVFLAPMSDFHLSNSSWIYFFKSMTRQGIFPLWNPFSVCGVPYGASVISQINVYNLLTFIWGNVYGVWNLVMLLNVIFAYVFTFLYLRRIGCSEFPSMVAGTVFALAPSSGCYVESFGFVLPLVLWLAEKYEASRKIRYPVLAVLSLSTFFLNVIPQYSLYTAWFFVLYVLFRFRSLWGLVTVIFSLGLISFHLFRVFEFLHESSRGNLWFINVLLPTHLVNFVFPFFFESPFRPETSFFFAKGFYELTRQFFGTDKIQYLLPPYLGVLGFTFVLFSWNERGAIRFHRNAAIIILLFWMAFPILSPVYQKIPLLAQLPRIVRLNTVLTFSLAVLAGGGIERLLRRPFSVKALSRFYGWGVGILVTGLLAIRWGVEWAQPFLRRVLTDYVERYVVSTPSYQAPVSFYLQRVEEFFTFVNQWTDLRDPSMALPLFFIGTSLLLLFLWKQGKLPKALFCGASLFLVCLDLFIYFRMTQYYSARPEDLRPDSGVVRFLKQDKELFRILTVMDDVGFGEARERVFLAPNMNVLYEIPTVEAYEPLLPARYVAFFKNFQRVYDKDPAGIFAGPEGDFDDRLADFLNVKYFITSKRKTLRRNLRLVFEDDRSRVYFNDTYFPRAFLVHHYEVIPEGREMLAFLKENKGDLNQRMTLEEKPLEAGEPGRPTEPGREEVTFKHYGPQLVEVEVRAAQEGFLLLTDNYYPGWKASRDGTPAKIYRADYSFRAVWVPRGEHVIRFFYDPASLRWGLAATGIFLLGGLAVVLRLRKVETMTGQSEMTGERNWPHDSHPNAVANREYARKLQPLIATLVR